MAAPAAPRPAPHVLDPSLGVANDPEPRRLTNDDHVQQAERRPLHDSIEAQTSASDDERRRRELRQGTGPGASARSSPGFPYRESIAQSGRRRAHLAWLRRRLRSPSSTPLPPPARSPAGANPLAVWERNLTIAAKRAAARRQGLPLEQGRATRAADAAVQEPDAVYRRSQEWSGRAELRRACATVDRDLDEMVGRGFLVRSDAPAALSFGAWKARTEFRFRRCVYDGIEAEIAALWRRLPT